MFCLLSNKIQGVFITQHTQQFQIINLNIMMKTDSKDQNLPSQPKSKKKFKKIVKPKQLENLARAETPNAEATYRSEADFQNFDELSAIVRDINQTKGKICLTRKEKKCLEEITLLASKTRAPLDDRLVHYYKQDVNKFSTPITVPEESVGKRELAEATAVTKETPNEIAAAGLNNLNTYLTNLKNLIARREMSWAAAQESDYTQKGEIARLKNEVTHLRVACGARRATINEKDKIIAEKDKKIAALEKFVNELKAEIIHLAKNNVVDCELPDPKTIEKDNKMMKPPGVQLRRNFGPAALLANGLNKARHAAAN